MRLWVESAHQSLMKDEAKVCGDVVRTWRTEDQFCAVLVGSPEQRRREGKTEAISVADEAVSLLKQGTPPEKAAEALLAALPNGEHTPFSILQIREGHRTNLVECDAPPLFLTRAGRLVLLPVVEEVVVGHLIRGCDFRLQDGDHMAMVSEGYVHSAKRKAAWSWQGVATAIRRWTETGCDAEQLLGALVRSYHRLAGEQPDRDVTVIAMRVRPLRTATVWSGPPADPALDGAALEKLVAEPEVRIICGDTTAEIAARLLGAELRLEPSPEGGWAEVPPTSRLAGVNLVTEGLVTLRQARRRMAEAKRVRNLPHKTDGATRLAQALLTSDVIHFIVGLAVNPVQAADDAGTIAMRRVVIDDLVRHLRARDKIVSMECL